MAATDPRDNLRFTPVSASKEDPMGVVMIRCPRTGTDVSTGLEMDQGTWDALPIVTSKIHCPACGAEHVWSKTYAHFAPPPAEAPPPVEIGSG